ncbi:MAG: YgaP-like transmembrane domain [Candidatus Nanohaloarchaea archaeon]
MEQNLSERERKIRLAAGILVLAATGALYHQGASAGVLAALALLGAGLVANYFTCFCGTKKLVKSMTGD